MSEGRPATADPAREAALGALLAIERGAPAGSALDRALRGVAAPLDRALATELVYGVTRRRLSLDGELAGLCNRPLRALEPGVRASLRLGLYQLRHARTPAYAAVTQAVALARRHGRPGGAGLVNAVLRRAAAAGAPQAGGEDADSLAAAHSHPAWLVARWLRRLGREETVALLEADNRPPQVVLRANALRCDGAVLRAELAAAGCAVQPGRYLPQAVRLGRGGAPGRLAALSEGRCTVQGEASMLVAAVAAPPAGSFCLDIAAAPGGKATHLAEWMRDDGRVVANDTSADRAAACAAAAARLGLTCVETRVGDARALPEAFTDRCDVVLADVPCSGLGALAGRPDLRWRKREADIAALSALQGELIRAAACCVKPGGVLIYSTCTTEPEENGAIVAGLLARRPDFRPLDLRPRLPALLAAEPSAAEGWLQLWPHRHGTEGFFIAALCRRDPARAE